MATTIGHSAVHGGLRGHSINAEIYPFIVVAQGNPNHSTFQPDGLRWYVRHPDGHNIKGTGFHTAEAAYSKAKDAKNVWERARA